jgi:hypothetical protein
MQQRLRQALRERDELKPVRRVYWGAMRRGGMALKRLAKLAPVNPREYGTLIFQCNVCGAPGSTKLVRAQREGSACVVCGSTARMRAIIHMMSVELFGVSLPLPRFVVRKDLVGLGLSDWDGYAHRLAEKFTYLNTYLHQEPRLDILRIDDCRRRSLDFLISSEVFEHVEPPVSRAFVNARMLLKPGGVLFLTTPYAPSSHLPATVEHFPDLFDYAISRDEVGRHHLTNRTRSGALQVFNDVAVHGGEGATLEMRLFAEDDLLNQLTAAGFSRVTVYREPVYTFGVYWPQPWSLPIAARA